VKKHLVIIAGLILAGPFGVTPPGWAQSGSSGSNAASQENSHFLPLFKSKVPEKYREHIPLPIGISFMYAHQVVPLELTEANVDVPVMPLPPGLVQGGTLKPVTNSYMARLDAWLLPFLNVYGIAGRFEGEVKDLKLDLAAPVSLPIPSQVSYSGSNYGVGFTGAFAYQRFFASYDINWSWAKPDLTNRVRINSQGPRIGMLISPCGIHSKIYGGVNRISIAGSEKGSVTLESGIPINFEVRVSPEQGWSPVSGAEVRLTRHFVTNIEGAFGQTKQIVLLTGYRF
jgi:hypothetical protein